MSPSRPYLDMITRTMGISAATALHQGHPCKLCGAFSGPFDSLDFYKYCSPTNPFAFGFAGIHVEYRRCQDCGFIFTDFFDDWAPQEFAAYVYNEDYPRIDAEYANIRPAHLATVLAESLRAWQDIDILDYGSGSGAFSQHLAKHGFTSIANYDPYSSPARPDRKFGLITCFEVIEHTISPYDCLQDMASFLAPGGCIVLSQPLQPADIEVIRGNWWYVGPRNGHASIFTADSLAWLGARCGLVFHHGGWLHGFTTADATGISRDIMAKFGEPYAWVRLSAPGVMPSEPMADAQTRYWHQVERHGGVRYRWTRQNRLVWTGGLPGLYPLKLRITVPFVNQIREGFAADCRIEIGGQELAPVEHRGKLIVETTLTETTENTIVLHTPDLESPRALRNVPDDRPLGVAIPIYPWIAPASL